MQVLSVRVVRHTRKFDKMMHFYRDVLEMRSISSWKRKESTGALLSPGKAMGQMVVEILDSKAHRAPRGSPVGLDLNLEVRNVDQWHDRLRKKGISVVDALEDKPWGHRAFTVEDPDGLRVTIFQAT